MSSSSTAFKALVAAATGASALWFARSRSQLRAAKQAREEKRGDSKDQLNAIFPELVAKFILHMRENYDLPEKAYERLERMIVYTCQGGKLNRAIMVLTATKELCRKNNLSYEQRREKAMVLGWCIEILQSHFLVADDMMDQSETRRDNPCWYKLPDIQYDAVNDAIILESFLYFLLKHYFNSNLKQYCELVDLFHEVSLCTQMGQMLDLTSQPQGQKNPQVLAGFSQAVYDRIVKYKTAIYTFYLSSACAMMISGYTDKKAYSAAFEICVALGNKFQIEDDYLDCYADPIVLGKIGTDIKDHKCSWLCVQALRLMNAEQRAQFEAHYGKEEKKDEDVVKQLFMDLNLKEIYEAQEDSSFASIQELVQANKDILPPNMFLPILNKIHGRIK
jgi:farnesyl diphosphate synthase